MDRIYTSLLVVGLTIISASYGMESPFCDGFNKDQEILISAVQSNAVATAERMLYFGANADGKDKAGTPLLITAAEAGNLPIASLLLEHRASVEPQERYGQESPLVSSLLQHEPRFDHKAIATLILAHPETTAAHIESAYYRLAGSHGQGRLHTIRKLAYYADKKNCIQLLKKFNKKYKIFPRNTLDIINNYCGLYHDVPRYQPLPERLTHEEEAQVSKIHRVLAQGYLMYADSDFKFDRYLKKHPILVQNLYNYFSRIQTRYRELSDYESACGNLRIQWINIYPDVEYEPLYRQFPHCGKCVGLKITVNKLSSENSLAAQLLLDAFSESSVIEGFTLDSVSDDKLSCTCDIPSNLYDLVLEKYNKDNPTRVQFGPSRRVPMSMLCL